VLVRVDTAALEELNLKPEETETEIAQNIVMLAATPKGSVPLERELGIDMSYQDRPAAAATVLFEEGLREAVNEYESRVSVEGAETYVDEQSGRIVPILEVIIND
jgi:hypothetical protein